MSLARSLGGGALLVVVAAGTGAWRIERAPATALEAVRQRLTDCAAPGPHCAPPGQFLHQRDPDTPLDPAFGLPDPDTLVSSAWVPLAGATKVLTLPSMAGRAFALQVLDQQGHRTALVTTTAPAERVPLAVDGAWVWIVARIAVAGEADLPAVHALQDALRVSPAPR